MNIKLKNLLSEGFEDAQPAPTPVDKKQFLEAVKRYSEYREAFGSSKDLKTKLKEIQWLVQAAEQVTLQETQEWFDEITVNRHMKQLKESYKVLEKTCNELITSQQRFESAYNDIGSILEKYYEL